MDNPDMCLVNVEQQQNKRIYFFSEYEEGNFISRRKVGISLHNKERTRETMKLPNL